MVNFLDDLYVVSTPKRAIAVHNILREQLWQHTKISVHHGKTRIWNRGGVVPDKCDVLEENNKGRVPEQTSSFLDLWVVDEFHARTLEVVVDGLSLFQGAQLAVDTTLVCLLTREGEAKPRTATPRVEVLRFLVLSCVVQRDSVHIDRLRVRFSVFTHDTTEGDVDCMLGSVEARQVLGQHLDVPFVCSSHAHVHITQTRNELDASSCLPTDLQTSSRWVWLRLRVLPVCVQTARWRPQASRRS